MSFYKKKQKKPFYLYFINRNLYLCIHYGADTTTGSDDYQRNTREKGPAHSGGRPAGHRRCHLQLFCHLSGQFAFAGGSYYGVCRRLCPQGAAGAAGSCGWTGECAVGGHGLWRRAGACVPARRAPILRPGAPLGRRPTDPHTRFGMRLR